MKKILNRDFFRKAGARGGKIGGKRRLETTTPEQRTTWARNAALARHQRDKEHRDNLPICQVLP